MDTVKELIHLGKQLFDKKQYDRAEHYLLQALKTAPKYADVHNLLGVIYHIHGRFQEAITSFQEALKINPQYTEALLNLAVLYNDLGQYRDAKNLYSALKKRQPGKDARIEPVLRGKLSNLHAEIGDIYRSIGLQLLAIQEYRKALDLNPAYHDIRTKLGQALRENNKYDESKKEFQTVLKAKQQYNPARIQLGVTLFALGKMNEAKKTWTQALSHNPQDEYAKMYLRLANAGNKKQSDKKSMKVKKKKK